MRLIHGTTWSVEDAQAYIRARVEEDANGCWIWQRAIGSHGYGVHGVPRKRQESCADLSLSHRTSYEAFVGPIPDGCGYHGSVIMHTCDVRSCANPEHLVLGTQEDNVVDMNAKGRRVPPSRPHRRLSADEVADIQRRWLAGEHAKDVAVSAGVSRATVFNHIRAVRALRSTP